MSAETNRRYRYVTVLIEQGKRYLIVQRCAPPALLGLWEFPGSKVEPGDTDEAALERTLHERLGVDVKVGALKARRTLSYVGYSVETTLYQGTLKADQTPRPLTVADFRWVTAEELEQYPFVPADQAATDLLVGTQRDAQEGIQARLLRLAQALHLIPVPRSGNAELRGC